jgi:hypothetical protein
MNNQSFLVNPDLRVILDQERDNSYSGLNCVRVGTVVSFNADTQTASIQLVNTAQVFNKGLVKGTVPQAPSLIPYPILQDVPVFVLRGGSTFIGMPVSQGDTCLVLFNDRDLDPWLTNGTTGAPPNTLRMHSMADGIALVGISAIASAFADYLSLGITVNGNLNVSTGASDVFTSADGATVTVVNGIIINIAR